MLADQTLTAAGATGTKTATFSTTGSLAATLIALQPTTTSYTYDPLGDRTTITTPTGTTTLTYNQQGQLTNYATTSYTYNGDGIRTSKKTGHTTTPETWSPSGANGIPTMLADGATDYLYDPNGLPLEQISGTTTLYYLHDQLDSTRVLTSSTGSIAASSTYTDYGTPAASTGTTTNPLGYTSAYTDMESGLQYLQHRYYDPTTAQLVSVDPLVNATGDPYGYVSDDPINGIDPWGMDPCLFGVCLPTPSFQDISNFLAGFGDTSTFGGTAKVRSWINSKFGLPNTVNECSSAYAGGGGAAIAADILLGNGLYPVIADAVDLQKAGEALETANEYANAAGEAAPPSVKAIQGLGGALKGARIDFSGMVKLRQSLGLPAQGGGWAGWPR